MTFSGGYSSALALAAGGLLLSSVLIVWRRQLTALVRLLACQGVTLGAIAIVLGVHADDITLITVGAVATVLRALVLPRVVGRLLKDSLNPRDTEPVVNTAFSLITTAALTIVAYAVTRPLTALDPSTATRAAPTAFAVVLIGLFLLVTRRSALSQIVGFLVLDNGITAVAFLTTAGVPLIVEVGASLDVLFLVLVLQILGGRMRIKFGATDVGELRELHE